MDQTFTVTFATSQKVSTKNATPLLRIAKLFSRGAKWTPLRATEVIAKKRGPCHL